MQIKQVDINNFMSFGQASLNLADRGLVLVTGENLDESSAASNGAGKSSVFNALAWCLFNKTDNGLSADDVVNNTIGKDCSVTCHINDNGVNYQVTRYRKDSSQKNRLVLVQILQDQEQDLTQGTDALTQEHVEQILGCSYEVFTSAVCASQERFPDLPSLTDKSLKALIEECSGVERLTKAYEVARSRLGDAKREYELSDEAVDNSLKKIGSLESDLQQASVELKRWEEQRAKRVTDKQREVETQEAKIVDAKSQINESDLAKIDQGLAKIAQKFSENSKFEHNVENFKINLTDAIVKYNDSNRQLNNLAHHIKNKKEEYTSVQSLIGTPCHSCGKPYTESDLGVKRDLLNKEFNDLVLQLESAKDAVALNQKEVDEAQREVDKAKAAVPDLSKLNKLSNDLQSKKQSIFKQQESVRQLEQQLVNLTSQVRQIQEEVNPNNQVISYLKDNLAKEQVGAQSAQTRKQQATEALLLAKDAADVFGPTGVRAEILDTVTPFLNERTGFYLDTLSDGNITATWQTLTRSKKGELKEKFSIDVTSTTGAKTYKGCSGGEKRKVKLATALALSDLVASRATKSIELFLADEIDAAMDESGMQRLMEVLNYKAAERGSVFVISHNDLGSYIRNSITVRKENGLATIEA